jgi:hypothetical protein
MEIARYTLERWREQQAIRYIDDLEAFAAGLPKLRN